MQPITRRQYRKWSDRDKQYLIDHWDGEVGVDAIASALECDRKRILTKARELGLRLRPDQPQWSPEELSKLELLAGTMPLPLLVDRWNREARQRGWEVRSLRAIERQIQKRGWSQTADAGWTVIASLAEALGHQNDNRIQFWISSKKLRCYRYGNKAYIADADLTRFALAYPTEIVKGISTEGMVWLLQAMQENVSLKAPPAKFRQNQTALLVG